MTVARSEKITGPYIGNPGNPILTHRHLGRDYPIVNVGHGDLGGDAQWRVVVCGPGFQALRRVLPEPGAGDLPRPGKMGKRLAGDEPGEGRVLFEYPCPDLPADDRPAEAACDHFDGPELDFKWVFLRTPRESFWSLAERPGISA